MSHPFNTRAEVERHVAKAGIDLPDATVDELVAYLEDLHAAALDEGASEDDARRRTLAALEESPFSVLRSHAASHPDRARTARADLAAQQFTGRRSLNVLSAIKLAVRQFRQHPTFALVTVLVLGLGTGAATTVFTVVDSVVLRPLPYEAPERLVTLWDTNTEKGLAHDPISPVNFMDYRALPVFTDAAGWWRPGVNLVDPGTDPMRVNTIEVSGNLFEVLGVKPQVGAGLPANGPFWVANELVIVISDRLWRTRYSADPSLIGNTLSLNDTPYEVVGVMPPKFHYPDDVDVWQRVRWDYHQHSRAAHFMEAVARLAPGTTFEQAQGAVQALGARLEQENIRTNKGWSARLIPLLDEELGYYRPALMVMFGAVGLLLIIGVLNVATLLLTRALSREKEIAVRVALGAAPRQLVTQLMAESLVLSVSGALGIVATLAALPLIINLTPVEIPRLDEAGINVRALGLCLGVVGVTTVIFGLVPALLLLRTQFTTDLKAGERGSSKGARRVYSVLVAAEVAMACALLVSSALLVRTVGQMMNTPTGVAADTVSIATVQLSPSAVGAPARGGTIQTNWFPVADVHTRILEEIRQQPGVTAAGASNFLPLSVGWRNPFLIEGQPRPGRQEDLPQAQMHSVSEGYFEAMGAVMAGGRTFTAFDNRDSAGAVIVNESFARRYLSDRNPVGQTVRTWATGIGPLGTNLKSPPNYRPPPEGMPSEVVGVVRDIRNVPLGQAVEPAIYFSTRQFPFSEVFIAVQAADASVAQTAIRNALRKVTPNVPMSVTQTWGERFEAKTAEARLLMTILLFFGGLAAVLAALGVYGLFSWSVALRTRELAIRLTLGAKPASVGALVIGQSAVLVVAGLAVGLVIVRLAESVLTRVVFGVTTSDAAALITASVLLLVAALVACVPPALRAMRVDPVEGLRAE